MMEDENLNPTGEEKEHFREARAAFYEKLLGCCACGKIYFSRHPVALLTVSPRNFYVCDDCSQKLTCSRCNVRISVETALVMETRQHRAVEILCPTCRDRVIVGSGFLLGRLRRSVGEAASSAVTAISGFLHMIIHSGIWPGRRRSRH